MQWYQRRIHGVQKKPHASTTRGLKLSSFSPLLLLPLLFHWMRIANARELCATPVAARCRDGTAVKTIWTVRQLLRSVHRHHQLTTSSIWPRMPGAQEQTVQLVAALRPIGSAVQISSGVLLWQRSAQSPRSLSTSSKPVS